MKQNKMNTKKLLVSFAMLVSILFLAVSVSAQQLADNVVVEVNGVNVLQNPAIVVGDSIFVRVEFASLVNASYVTVQTELEGDRQSVKSETAPFDVETGQTYVRTLRIDVPFDLRDKLSGFVDLNIKVSGNGFRTDATVPLKVQRTSFDANVLHVSVPQTIKAGEIFPVDVVLKNIGYNNLDDLFVTARISALGIERTSFFGDIVALECDKSLSSVENYGVDISRKCNEDHKDTITGRIFLHIPYDVDEGIYALEVKVNNEDTTSSQVIQVVIENAFSSGHFVVSGNQILIVNPTNEVVVYRIVPVSTSTVSVSVSESIVAVSPGTSKTVNVDATSSAEGAQTYSVNVFAADGTLVDTVTMTSILPGRDVTNPIVILTIVLAIIFIVLLVVLIVLIGKKPEKEEFGESYY